MAGDLFPVGGEVNKGCAERVVVSSVPVTSQQRKPKLKKPPILFSKTQRIVRAIAEETDGTFLTYWNSAGGSVCHNDVMGFYEVLQRIGHQDALHLFIKSR